MCTFKIEGVTTTHENKKNFFKSLKRWVFWKFNKFFLTNFCPTSKLKGLQEHFVLDISKFFVWIFLEDARAFLSSITEILRNSTLIILPFLIICRKTEFLISPLYRTVLLVLRRPYPGWQTTNLFLRYHNAPGILLGRCLWGFRSLFPQPYFRRSLIHWDRERTSAIRCTRFL